MNLAFMAKIEWRLLKEADSLWVKVLVGKYVQEDIKIENFKPK